MHVLFSARSLLKKIKHYSRIVELESTCSPCFPPWLPEYLLVQQFVFFTVKDFFFKMPILPLSPQNKTKKFWSVPSKAQVLINLQGKVKLTTYKFGVRELGKVSIASPFGLLRMECHSIAG